MNPQSEQFSGSSFGNPLSGGGAAKMLPQSMPGWAGALQSWHAMYHRMSPLGAGRVVDEAGGATGSLLNPGKNLTPTVGTTAGRHVMPQLWQLWV
jgi:hypothetical protein